MTFLDAHNHLHDARLVPHRAEIFERLAHLDGYRAVVNGTCEADWNDVARLAAEHDWIVPSFGLHPWFVENASAVWRERLLEKLDAHARAGIGEIGLDRWIEPHDLPRQIEAFEWQLALAAERNLPASIHCLKAWGPLWDLIRERPVPARGFLLHAFGGPAEMVSGFLDRGAHFSFSSYFLHERKAAIRDIFHDLPADRLLVETDAPDMAPPPARTRDPLTDTNGKALSHPANIELAYTTLAELRGASSEALAQQIEANFERLFGDQISL